MSGVPDLLTRCHAVANLVTMTMTSHCQQCGGPLSNARAGLGLTLCSGACHRATQIQSFQQDAISARARGDFVAERFALDALALIERATLMPRVVLAHVEWVDAPQDEAPTDEWTCALTHPQSHHVGVVDAGDGTYLSWRPFLEVRLELEPEPTRFCEDHAAWLTTAAPALTGVIW